MVFRVWGWLRRNRVALAGRVSRIPPPMYLLVAMPLMPYVEALNPKPLNP